MKRSTLIAVAALAFAATLAVAVPGARAADLCVSSRTGCFPTLQAALAAAHDGDTIHLGAGTFQGGVTVAASIDLVGAGPARTFIKGGGPVLTIGTYFGATEPTVSISGVTITGGVNTTEPDVTVEDGGGVCDPAVGRERDGRDRLDLRQRRHREHRRLALAHPAGPFCDGFTCSFAFGGGIDDSGNLTLTNTLVANNVAGSTTTRPARRFPRARARVASPTPAGSRSTVERR